MEPIFLSEQKLNAVVLRLFKLCQIPLERAFPVYAANWTLTTEKGIDLFSLQNPISPIFSAALFHAMAEHRGLLSASIATAETDREKTLVLSVSDGKISFGGKTPFSYLVLNAAFADSLQLLLDEIGDLLRDRTELGAALLKTIAPLLKKYQKSTDPLYLEEKSFQTYAHLLEKKAERALEEILSPGEIAAKQESLFEAYVKAILEWAHREKNPELEKILGQLDGMGWEAKARICGELIAPKRVPTK